MVTSHDLLKYGITDAVEIIYNPSYDLLFEEETKPGLDPAEKGTLTRNGAVAIDTGNLYRTITRRISMLWWTILQGILSGGKPIWQKPPITSL